MTTNNRETGLSHARGTDRVQWRGGTIPVSTRFDDTYFSDVDGRGETREVFLRGNGLPDRWRNAEGFTVAELGFGTGLNFLETVSQWRSAGKPGASLRYVSFEKYPLCEDDLWHALSPWPDLTHAAETLLGAWPPDGPAMRLEQDGVTLDLHIGDARSTIGKTAFYANAWYLDGFSPAKNPELWDADLLQSVYDHTSPGGSFSTFTAAGWVRRNLEAAGFDVERVPGFARKRERLQGARPVVIR